ncbi:MAG: SapC family protein [Pseudomonadota bacterium]
MDTPQGAPAADGQLSGNVLFYRQPEPLSHAAHGNLGVKQIAEPFGFLRTAHAIPITVTEFGIAATSYPIIFVGTDYTPIAVMGVRQAQNLYVTDDGRTEADYYVPAFVRRYPFVFANDDANNQLLLCVDRDAPMVTDQPEVPFFEGEQPSQFTQDAIEFCKEFERQRLATVHFTDLMKKHDLFEEKSISFQPRDTDGNEMGEAQKIADYWAISEERIAKLSDEAYLELRTAGAFGAIYSHLVGLLNWPNLIQRALRTPAETEGTA